MTFQTLDCDVPEEVRQEFAAGVNSTTSHRLAVTVDGHPLIVEYDYYKELRTTRLYPGEPAEVELVTVEVGGEVMDADKFSHSFKRAIEAAVMKEHE